MGNNVLIAILGLLFFFSVINKTINERDKDAAVSTYGYVKYTYARDIARDGINIALKYMADSGTGKLAYPDSVLTGTIEGGSYSVNDVVNVDTVWLTSRSNFEDTVYKIKSKLFRTPKPFPTTG